MSAVCVPQNVKWFSFLLVCLLFAACSEPSSDENRLRQAVAEMEKAVEARQAGPILDYLADDFQGNAVYRKANIHAMLLMHFRQNQNLHVYLRIADLKLAGNKARLLCRMLLVGRDEEVVPERGKVLEIVSDWEKRDGDWQVVKATWKDPLLQP